MIDKHSRLFIAQMFCKIDSAIKIAALQHYDFFDSLRMIGESVVCRRIFLSKGYLPSYIALQWAIVNGDLDLMRGHIATEADAYEWACRFGDRDLMVEHINTQIYIYLWGKNVGHRELMRSRITDPWFALCWARDIGDHDKMLEIVKNTKYQEAWDDYFSDAWCERKLG